jgi:hypothetical protein
MKCKMVEKEIVLGRLRLVFDFVSKGCFMGRFGGGWNWEVGFQAGGKTIILNLLIFTLRIEIMLKVEEGDTK